MRGYETSQERSDANRESQRKREGLDLERLRKNSNSNGLGKGHDFTCRNARSTVEERPFRAA